MNYFVFLYLSLPLPSFMLKNISWVLDVIVDLGHYWLNHHHSTNYITPIHLSI